MSEGADAPDSVAALEARLAALAADAPAARRVDLLNALAWRIGFREPVRAVGLAREALVLAERDGYEPGRAHALFHLAVGDYYAGRHREALRRGGEALEIFERLGDRAGVARCRNGFGMVHWGLGDYDEALAAIREALAVFDELGETHEAAWSRIALGGIYENLGDLETAMEHYDEALSTFRTLGDRLGEGRALSGIGTVYHREGRLDDALDHHCRSLALFRGVGDRLSESRALNDIAEIHRALGHTDGALAHHEEALRLRREMGNRQAEVTSLLNLGRLHEERGEPRRALEYLEPALELARAVGAKQKVARAHEALAAAYERLGEPERALEHHKAFHRAERAVFGEESALRLKNLEVRFGVERAERQTEIERLRRVELAEALKKLQETQARLVQSEKMAALGKLVAGLLHELNTPAGVVAAATDVVRRAAERLRPSPEDEPDAAGPWDALASNAVAAAEAARRISGIVESLRAFAEAEDTPSVLVDVRDVVEAALRLLASRRGDGIRLVRRFEAVPAVEARPAQLQQALLTVLLNALDAMGGEGTLTLTTSARDGRVVLAVADTGRGIEPEKLPRLFEVDFVRRGSRIRMRAGLAHVRSVIESHGGTVRVETEPQRGTTFYLELPAAGGGPGAEGPSVARA